MRRSGPFHTTRGATAQPAVLVGLALGLAFGAVLAGGPARSAEGASKPSAVVTRYAGDARYQRCLDESDGTNTAWARCGADLIAREDARMNQAWKRAYTPDSDAKSKELLDEQRAWLAYRDASCLLYQSGRFGREGQVLSYPVCRAGVIAERAGALDAYAAPEGR